MASAEQPRVAHSVDAKVMGSVEGKVQDLRGDVQDVRGDVQDIGNRILDVDGMHWQGIDSNAQSVDDKFDQANRSLSL